MKDACHVWEYLIVYIDGINVTINDAETNFNDLQGPNVCFIIKGMGMPHYILGEDFFRDIDGTLSLGSQTYAKHLSAR